MVFLINEIHLGVNVNAKSFCNIMTHCVAQVQDVLSCGSTKVDEHQCLMVVDGSTAQWIFGIQEVIEDLSAAMTLRAGTIISMGTPAGVGMGFDPPKYLKFGDVVVCEADGLGKLTNYIR